MRNDFLKSVYECDFLDDMGNLVRISDLTNLVDYSGIIRDFNEYIKIYEVFNDEKIEVISYKIYGSPEYWDLLFILNGIQSFSELPKNEELILNRAKRTYEEWESLFGYKKTDEFLIKKRQEIIDLEFNLNEKFRKLKYIAKEQIMNFKNKTKALEKQIKLGKAIDA